MTTSKDRRQRQYSKIWIYPTLMILSDVEWQAVELSLKVSAIAVIASLPFGIFRPAAGAL